jgi:hypothetical protein
LDLSIEFYKAPVKEKEENPKKRARNIRREAIIRGKEDREEARRRGFARLGYKGGLRTRGRKSPPEGGDKEGPPGGGNGSRPEQGSRPLKNEKRGP